MHLRDGLLRGNAVRRSQLSKHGLIMFKKVNNVQIQRMRPKTGFFEKAKPAFYRISLTQKYYCDLSREEWVEIRKTQVSVPVLVTSIAETGRRFWAYQGNWYVEDEDLYEEAVRALIEARDLKQQRKIQRAMAIVNFQAEPSNAPIPDEVKMFVMQRDGGRCVKCGAQQDLHFDHVIPRSQGGGNGPQNIQLLCANCNWSKGGSVV